MNATAQPEARVYRLERDENDREAWEMVKAYQGRFRAEIALTRYCIEEEPDLGTYGCEDHLGRWRTGLWDGERVVA